jgi:hypothetical protein
MDKLLHPSPGARSRRHHNLPLAALQCTSRDYALCSSREKKKCQQCLSSGAIGFGWDLTHADVSRRQPISAYPVIARRTHMYTCAAKVWFLQSLCQI